MNKHTFTPGTCVRVFPTGKLGTVVNAPEVLQRFPGFVPVHFDGSDSLRACSPDNLIVVGTIFAPGNRVWYSPAGVAGTVVEAGWESGADVVLVHIDGAPMATVCYLAELVRLDLDHVSDADLGAEVAKRLSESHEDALREEMQREVEAAAHRWQAARMTEKGTAK